MKASPLRAVVFDAYGTLVHITDRRNPYAAVLKAIPNPNHETRTMPLYAPTTLSSFAKLAGADLSAARLAELEEDLSAELASIKVFDDVAPVWAELRKRGIRIGVCSNLATPYIKPVLDTLPFPPDAACWSCESGMMKDEPASYLFICASLGVHVSCALMVGDSYAHDYVGPINQGMHALHLRRKDAEYTLSSIPSLYELLRITDLHGFLESHP